MASCSSQANLCRCLDSTEAENISTQGNAHVHCQCTLCVGKAVYPMTAWRHVQRERLAQGEDQSAGNRDIIFNNEENEERLSIISGSGSDSYDGDESIHVQNLDGHESHDNLNQQGANGGGYPSGDDSVMMMETPVVLVLMMVKIPEVVMMILNHQMTNWMKKKPSNNLFWMLY